MFEEGEKRPFARRLDELQGRAERDKSQCPLLFRIVVCAFETIQILLFNRLEFPSQRPRQLLHLAE